ncbi:MAG: hypothetical protein JST52_05850 [Bacteroidetes bacterium]|nr:hypothetical protein [Bacteroidota bacterium]MBS1740003.1 hypothetical protein [Bacteroidota bacterium]MBS1777649.1 hypothetical protein [Bacteroidota bacterium]
MKRRIVIVLISIFFSVPVLLKAQGCSVCTKTAAGLDGKAAKGLNGGVIYLAFFPLAILGTIGLVWWRGQRQTKKEE